MPMATQYIHEVLPPENAEVAMPVYVFRCAKCDVQFEKSMTVAEREKAKPACPECKGRKVVPVLSGFFAKTSRKS